MWWGLLFYKGINNRFLLGNRKKAIRQLAMMASKIDVEVDKDNYNSQYSDTNRAILKVLKRVM